MTSPFSLIPPDHAYTLIHSSDPEATAASIIEYFKGRKLEVPDATGQIFVRVGNQIFCILKGTGSEGACMVFWCSTQMDFTRVANYLDEKKLVRGPQGQREDHHFGIWTLPGDVRVGFEWRSKNLVTL